MNWPTTAPTPKYLAGNLGKLFAVKFLLLNAHRFLLLNSRRQLRIRRLQVQVLPGAPTSAAATGLLTRETVVVRRAHFAGEVDVRFGGAIAGENFLFRIPREFAAGSQRDDDQVPDAGGTMTAFYAGNRIVARTHAVEKIAQVVVAHLQLDRVVRQRREEQLFVARGDFIAVDPDPAVRADKFHAVALAVFVEHLAEWAVGGRGFDDLLHGICPDERGFKFAGRGIAVGQGRRHHLGLNRDRAVQTDAPARDVVVMRAPVRHGTSGIIKPPPERRVAAFGEIFRRRCLAEPEVVIEFGGDGNFFERATTDSGGDKHIHLFQSADASIADQFAREAKTLAAALLRAGLENNFILTDGFDDVPALVNRERQRLFAIDILFGLGRRQVDERVPMIRRRLHDGVNVIALQQFSEVAIFRGCPSVFRKTLRGGVNVPLIHITDGQNVAKARGVFRVALAHAATTDERDAGPVVRARLGGRVGYCVSGCGQLSLDKPQGQTSRCRRGGATGEEDSARDMKRFVHIFE